MNIVLKNILIYTIGFFVLIQLYQVDIQISKTDPKLEIKAPIKVMNILKRSCYDCHSNNIILPWYSKIAPISWTMSRHINIGRQWVNFSIWETYSKKKQEKKLQEIYKAVYLAMPIKSYVWKHPEASLSQEDKNLLRQWTGKAPF
jgi:hypothetical protein